MIKAIALMSGGLDSILAAKIIMMQGVQVEGVNFSSVFHSSKSDGIPIESTAEMLGIPIKVFDISEELFNIVKNPKHGYGSGMNPCIDCHAFMFKRAGAYMKESGASFLITGEVLGERPMSQRKPALDIVEKESGMSGLILRPLSAKLLEPSIPEEKGWVSREKLLSIEGRSRKPQIELAKELGITKYPTPAGGCLLTDKSFADRLKDIMQSKSDAVIQDIRLLRAGRHFRLAGDARLAVGRDRKDNDELLKLAQPGDIFFYPVKRKGPIALGRRIRAKGDIIKASAIVARYSDKDPVSNENEIEIACKDFDERKSTHIKVLPMAGESLEGLRI